MALQPSSFFTTRSFDAAWQCYQDWCAFQQRLNLSHQVELAGCHINGCVCWDVRITQRLHDTRVAGLDSLTVAPSNVTRKPYRWALAVPLAVVGLSGGVWFSSIPQGSQSEPKIQEEPQFDRRLN